MSSAANAATILVDPRANGLFGTFGGALVRDGVDLVEVDTLSAGGQSVEITATGSVYLGTGALPTTGPDGAGPFDRISFLSSPAAYLPLEEALVDAAGTLASSFDDIGALFAVFVPESVASAGGFLPRNIDVGGAITSDALFLVGSGPVLFTAPEPGRLYFGVNDSFGNNNTGGYTVTTTAVPEPASALLLTLGILLACSQRRRSNEV